MVELTSTLLCSSYGARRGLRHKKLYATSPVASSGGEIVLENFLPLAGLGKGSRKGGGSEGGENDRELHFGNFDVKVYKSFVVG